MHDKRLPESHKCGSVHGSRLESRRVRVVVAASGGELEARTPSEARGTEERAVAHAGTNLVEEAGWIAVPSDLAKLVAELGAPAERIERAPVLLARGEEKRPRRDREPRDERVQPVGRRLRERDAGRTGGIAE